MKKTAFAVAAPIAVAALALLTACASPDRRDDRFAEPPRYGSSVRSSHGQVRSIEAIPVASRTSGAGAVLGAVVGAVVGNQFGSGSGRAAATGAGAIAGAVAGNEIEKRRKRDDEVFRVSVRFEDGSIRDFDFHSVDDLRVGDRVRAEGGQLYRI